MATRLNDVMTFSGISFMNNAVSAITSATNTVWTVNSLSTQTRTIAANETTAANIAVALATLIFDLRHRGILNT